MKKLSKTQTMVLEKIITEIKEMRSKSLEQYLNERYQESYLKRVKNASYQEWLNSDENEEWITKHYYDTCKGNIKIHGVNKRTLAKLQEFGYIDTIEEWYSNDEKIQVNLEACGL